MRIIEKKEPEIEITCPDCKSVLAVNKDDIRHWSSRDIDGGSSDGYDAKCPVCGSRFDIPEKKVPRGVAPMTCDYEPQDDAERAVIADMLKIASEYSLENEVMWEYKANMEDGCGPWLASSRALYAWDL